MKKHFLKGAVGKSKLYLQRSSPTILSFCAAGGVIATSIMFIKATSDFVFFVEHKEAVNEVSSEKEMTARDKIRYAIPYYAPAFLTGMATITCIFGANALNKKRQASLISAYTLLDNKYRTYQKKVAEKIGEEDEREIEESISKETSKSRHIETNNANGDKLLFYDEYSDRYFWRSMLEIIEAEYQFNRNFALLGYTTLNELYDFLGLERTEFGDSIGWSMNAGLYYGYSWIDFQHHLVKTENDQPDYFLLLLPFEPTADFSE